MKRFFCLLVIFFTLFCHTGSSLSLTIPEEKELAKTFMAMIKEQKMILNDPAATHMVNQVGKIILSLLPPQPFDYSFYVVDEDVFNAFASPGANIFFYRGLITSLDSIDELAGIMAHEIAHASSRHVAESINRSKYINIGSLAGILAGAIIGSQSGGETGAAIIKSSMAIGHTAMLAYTRENETEADEKGIMFLKNTCFSPRGLLSGLVKIRDSDFRGIEAIPEYVKTHPGTGNRIAHVETILSDEPEPETRPSCGVDFNFNMIKYRLLGRYADVDTTIPDLTNQLKKNPSNPALHYGLGLAYDRKFMHDNALFHLKKALSIKIFDPLILVELGRIYLEKGETLQALNIFKSIESDPVLGQMVKFYSGVAHLEMGNLETAKNHFSTIISQASEQYPKAYFHQANIFSKENNTGLSHYYLGLYYNETGGFKTARVHLTKALESLDTPDEIKNARSLLEKINKKIATENNPKR